jgi:hypothetical protein
MGDAMAFGSGYPASRLLLKSSIRSVLNSMICTNFMTLLLPARY